MLSFYYPPDLSAGSFRASALVSALQKGGAEGLELEVITAQPSRYRSFTPDAPERECSKGVTVRRVLLPAVRPGLLGQIWQFGHFALGAWRLARQQRFDMVVATSSRLMTAVLGALIATTQGARLYLDIRDIFVETLEDVFTSKIFRPAVWIFSRLERFAIWRASRVNLVSPGFLPYFEARYPGRAFSLHPNGVDEEFGKPITQPLNEPGEQLRVVYAGNVGDGQGLHCVVPELALRLADRAHFQIVGDGGRLAVLTERLKGLGVKNVELINPVSRKVLREIYREADVLLLHLNDCRAFRRVLPSKLFEYAASGKPIWAGVAGYSAEFIANEVPNAAVFHPCDVEGAIAALERLSLEEVPREEFASQFSRQRIMQEMARDVLAVLPAKTQALVESRH
ncbi:MAG TPA: glycosyltransferase family 4 protein [Pseudomonas sp.]|nr:glycosyltransferase family 4 protein [Pseudomonas sp.]